MAEAINFKSLAIFSALMFGFIAGIIVLAERAESDPAQQHTPEEFARSFTAANLRCQSALWSMAKISAQHFQAGKIGGDGSAMLRESLNQCEVSKTEFEKLTPLAIPSPYDRDLVGALDQCRLGVNRAISGLQDALRIVDLGRDLTPEEGRELMAAAPLYQNAGDEYLLPCLTRELKSFADAGVAIDRHALRELAKSISDNAERRMSALY